MHVTRMWPRHEAELLAGGSLHWVFKGLILARQRLLRLDPQEGGDSRGDRCARPECPVGGNRIRDMPGVEGPLWAARAPTPPPVNPSLQWALPAHPGPSGEPQRTAGIPPILHVAVMLFCEKTTVKNGLPLAVHRTQDEWRLWADLVGLGSIVHVEASVGPGKSSFQRQAA